MQDGLEPVSILIPFSTENVKGALKEPFYRELGVGGCSVFEWLYSSYPEAIEHKTFANNLQVKERTLTSLLRPLINKGLVEFIQCGGVLSYRLRFRRGSV